MSRLISLLTPAVFFGIVLVTTANAEDKDPSPVASAPPTGHFEVPDDPKISVLRAEQATSPAVLWKRGAHTAVQVNVNAFGDNIVGDAANEPSIAVDPNDPMRMAIGWRQFDTISSNWRQAGWAFTQDGGQTWTFPGSIEDGVFRSDPVLDANADGHFLYNSLTADDPTGNPTNFRCHVFRSVDGGATWGSGVYAHGGDKQWQVIDTTDGIGRNNVYATWNSFYSSCSGSFTRSCDGGLSFEPCESVTGSPYWGTLAVGPDGELYISGTGITVVKSTNAKDCSQDISWDFSRTVDLDGSIDNSGGPNPGGLLGQCGIDVDRSDGPTRGYVYVLSSVSRYSTADPMDVMFSRSVDGGNSWSAPVRVNDDIGDSAWQWFGTMSVAPNGRIDAVWLDTRNDPGGYESELYYSYSTDTGVTWSANEVLTLPFDPHVGWPQQNKMGDYFDMVSDEWGANLAFCATLNGEQDVYFMRLGDPACPLAGRIEFDRPKYQCDADAEIVLLDCDLNEDNDAVETYEVPVISDSDTTGIQVLLTESHPSSGRFSGTVTLGESSVAGQLLVAEGDAVTATYIDADNGEGGTNVVVLAEATVDCTVPMISNIRVEGIEAREATVTLDADEPVKLSVSYGTACGMLSESVAGTDYSLSPTVDLSSLNHSTTYYYTVNVEDEAGNSRSDDNGGTCFTFSTPQLPNYYTELFESSDNDLDNWQIVFHEDGSNDYYQGCSQEYITTFPTDPAGGTTLSLGDDEFATVNLTGGKTFSFYGVQYSTFYPCSNGYICFGSGESGYNESLSAHFDGPPRISALFDDLDPRNGGTISYKQLSDRIAVTWQGITEHSQSSTNSFQIVMHFNGELEINYLDIAATDGLAGLSEGEGLDPEFVETDLSAMGTCDPVPPRAIDSIVTTAVDTFATFELEAVDDGLPDPPGVLDFIITQLPAHGSLNDLASGAIVQVPYTLSSQSRMVGYLPDQGYRGADSFMFKANDGGEPFMAGDSNEATVSITVGGAAWEPVAHGLNISLGVNEARNITLQATDPNGDTLTYSIESLPATGWLVDPNADFITVVPYELVDQGRVVIYVPPCGQSFDAPEPFSYSAADATASSNVAQVNLTVVSGGPSEVYSFPMDVSPGWSTEGLWAFGTPSGGGSHHHDPLSGHTGDSVYGYNLFGDYQNNRSTVYSLTTVPFDCSSLSDTELRFWRWLGVEQYDTATVEVSNNGLDWYVVWQNPANANVDDAAWSMQTYDISGTADGQEQVQIRWTMGPTDLSTSYPGWNIDDVSIYGVVPVLNTDFNGDGHIDLSDFGLFEECMSGPESPMSLECLCKDLNGDGQVDLTDFALFQVEF